MLLEKELEQGNTTSQQVLEEQNVGPREIIAIDTIPAASIDTFDLSASSG